jgi:hypothetical protein
MIKETSHLIKQESNKPLVMKDLDWAHSNLRNNVKFSLEQAMKAQMGSKGIDLLFL